MPDPTYPITGLKTGWSPNPRSWGPKNIVPTRVEADDFFTDEKYAIQRDLLYHAMAEWVRTPYDQKLSYFQVAGIHGMPHVPWDAEGMYHRQYCEHSTVMFPTWHRPYMALVEQRLYEIMVNAIIPQYPSEKQAAMKAEADQFRLPYWDWALKKQRTKDGKPVVVYDLPLIVKQKEVEVTDPVQGGLGKIPNPFYNFKANNAMGEYNINPVRISGKNEPYEAIPFDRARTTSRFQSDPNKDDKVMDGFVSAEGINELEGIAEDITEAHWYMKNAPKFKLDEAVNRLLTPGYFKTYAQFATTSKAEADKDGKYWLSLEGIHNNIHNWTGRGFGHMANVPVAAFDPIFWLHHANIDRLLCIWQELNVDQWWTKAVIKDDTGRVIRTMTPDQPLKPFHADTKGTFYSSNSCRHHFELGYTYPDLQPWEFATEKAYQSNIETVVNQKYAPPAATQLAMTNHDVVVNVSFEKFALDGVPFTVRVFLADEAIGEVHNFSFFGEAPDGKSACENCEQQQAAGAIVTGQVFVTEELIEAVKDSGKDIKKLSKEDIASYVKANLSWKAYKPNGNEVEIPSLVVTPFIGRQKLVNVSKPTTDEGAKGPMARMPVEGGVVGLPGIHLEDLPGLEAEWVDGKRTIKVHAHAMVPLVVKVEGWDDYEPL